MHHAVALPLLLLASLAAAGAATSSAASAAPSGREHLVTLPTPASVTSFCEQHSGCRPRITPSARRGGVVTAQHAESFIVSVSWIASTDTGNETSVRSLALFSAASSLFPVLETGFSFVSPSKDQDDVYSLSVTDEYAMAQYSVDQWGSGSRLWLFNRSSGDAVDICFDSGSDGPYSMDLDSRGNVVVMDSGGPDGQYTIRRVDLQAGQRAGAGAWPCQSGGSPPLLQWARTQPSYQEGGIVATNDVNGVKNLRCLPAVGATQRVVIGFSCMHALLDYPPADAVVSLTWDYASLWTVLTNDTFFALYNTIKSDDRDAIVLSDLQNAAPFTQNPNSWAAMSATFSTMDTNSDGRVSYSEFFDYAETHYCYATADKARHVEQMDTAFAASSGRPKSLQCVAGNMLMEFCPPQTGPTKYAHQTTNTAGYLGFTALHGTSQYYSHVECGGIPAALTVAGCFPFGTLSDDGIVALGCEPPLAADPTTVDVRVPVPVAIIKSATTFPTCRDPDVVLNFSRPFRMGPADMMTLGSRLATFVTAEASWPPTIHLESFSLCSLGLAPINGSCVNCSAGTYQDDSTIGGCKACRAGTYSPVSGLVSADLCRPCPIGSFSESVAATSASTCTLCPAGTVYAPWGIDAATSGSIGASGRGVCLPCPSGTYSDQPGSTACTPAPTCPLPLSTSPQGRSDSLSAAREPSLPAWPESESLDVALSVVLWTAVGSLATGMLLALWILLRPQGRVKASLVTAGRAVIERTGANDRRSEAPLAVSVITIVVLVIAVATYNLTAFGACNRVVLSSSRSMETDADYGAVARGAVQSRQVTFEIIAFGGVGACSGPCESVANVSVVDPRGRAGHLTGDVTMTACRLSAADSGVCVISIDTNLGAINSSHEVDVSVAFVNRAAYLTKIGTAVIVPPVAESIVGYEQYLNTPAVAAVSVVPSVGNVLRAGSERCSVTYQAMAVVLTGNGQQQQSQAAADAGTTVVPQVSDVAAGSQVAATLDDTVAPFNVTASDELGLDVRLKFSPSFTLMTISKRVSAVQLVVAMASAIGGALSFGRILYVGIVKVRARFGEKNNRDGAPEDLQRGLLDEEALDE